MNNLDAQDFEYINSVRSNEFHENQRVIQREKRLSISSIDEELYESIQLPQIHNIKKCLDEVLNNRDVVIAFILKHDNYLKSLTNTFEDLEDFEDYEGLVQIYEIIKALCNLFYQVFSCDSSIVEILLDTPYYLLTFGAFEYDPCNNQNNKYRKFLKEKSEFQLDSIFENQSHIKQIIIKNYRMQYLRDCVVAYQVDEQLSGVLNSVIFQFNIIQMILDHEYFFTQLFNLYDMGKCIHFLDEFLNTLKSLIQQEVKSRAILLMNYSQIFFDICDHFVHNTHNESITIQILNIFQNLQTIDQNQLVRFLMDKYEISSFMNALTHIVLNYPNGPISSLLELLKSMTENGVQQRFLLTDNIYFKLLQPLLTSTKNLNIQRKIIVIDFITEFLIFSVIKHGFKSRGFCTQQRYLQQLWEYIDLNQKNILLQLVRLFKTIILQKDDIMNKYLQQNDLISPIIHIFVKLKKNNNIIYSCFLELLYFVNKNDVKKVISGIFEKNYYILIKEPIWQTLKQKYERQSDFNPKQNNENEAEIQTTKSISNLRIQGNFIKLENKDESFQRQLECEEEENYFNEQEQSQEMSNLVKVDSEKIKSLQRKLSEKGDETQENDKLTFQKPTILKPQATKTKFSFNLQLGLDTLKKVKMDEEQ